MSRAPSGGVVAASLLLVACAARLPPPSQSYEQALRFGEPRRGVVLFLHGCDGLGGRLLFPWQTGWARHLTERGFLVVAPNSFADPRPAQACDAPFPNKERIYRIRERQTMLALERLRAEYPTSRLLVWGHSEGAGVANLIRGPVDGIVTTGYQCGFRSTRRMMLDPGVPLLVIVGSDDQLANAAMRSAGAATVAQVCRDVLTSRRWRSVVVPGMGHAAPLDRGAVREALDRFLDEVAPPVPAGGR